MNNKNGFLMDMKAVAVFSKYNGEVSVLVECSRVGMVTCHVEKYGLNEIKVRVAGMENQEPLNDMTISGLNTFFKEVADIGGKAFRYCYWHPEEWVVVNQDNEYDIFALKRILDKELLESSAGLKVRFPFFKEYRN